MPGQSLPERLPHSCLVLRIGCCHHRFPPNRNQGWGLGFQANSPEHLPAYKAPQEAPQFDDTVSRYYKEEKTTWQLLLPTC
jgi:hypothetical protein